VLTAGHCVTSENNRLYSPEEFDVRLGALTTEDGASVPVRKVIRHEGYDPDMLTNDIALLVLDTPANITSLIAPIRIYTGRVIERQNVTAFGWGKTENGTAATRLMTTRLVVGNTPSCQQVDPSYDGPNGNWTCVEYSLSKTAVCNGDSGGPM
ncbi:trypsin-like serine protease, partial [Ramicandelaber brevisporus]